MRQILTNELPVLEVAEGTIVSKSGDYTIAFEITKPEIFTQSGEDYTVMQQCLAKAIGILPPGTIIHFQDWYRRQKYLPGAGARGLPPREPERPQEPEHPQRQEHPQGQESLPEPPGDFLTVASDRYFHGRPYLDHRSFLYITRLTDGEGQAKSRLAPRSPLPTLASPHLVPEDTLSPGAVQQFGEAAARFTRILCESRHFSLRPLSVEDLSGSGDKAGIIEQYIMLNPPGHPRQVGDYSGENDFTISDRPCFFYTLSDMEQLPPQCSCCATYRPYSTDRSPFPLGYTTPIGPLLDCDHIVNQYVFLPHPGTTQARLELKERRHRSLAAHSRNNAVAAGSVNAFLNEAAVDQRTMARLHINVMAWTDGDPAALKTQVASSIAYLGATPHLETVSAPLLWWAGIPGNAGDLPVYVTFDTFAEQAACFHIFETNYQHSTSPTGIRMGDRTTGRPLNVDYTDEAKRKGIIQNLNKFALGGSGTGKSVLINHLVHTAWQHGAHICIADIGGSYKGLCELLGGYYFTYSNEAPMRFNPFWLPPGASPDTEKCESIKTLIFALWKRENEPILGSEYVAVSNSLQAWYAFLAARPAIFPCFNSYYEYMLDHYPAVLAGDGVREKDFDLQNLLYVLKPFYRGGEYDHLLNAETQLDLLDQRFIVFELDSIRDHPILFTAVTIMIMEIFMSKVRNLPGARKTLVFDEAWKALARTGTAEFIKYAYKTLRKFNGEAIVATQEVDDIVSSPVVRQAIINNADCRILLDQSKFQNRFDEIANILGLTANDKALVLSLNKANDGNYKEVFIGLPNSASKVYRNELSPEELLIYTTDARQKLKVQEYAKKYGSIRRGVEVLVSEIRKGSVRFIALSALCLLSLLLPNANARAQIPIGEIIKAAVNKVIIATDLKIQRFQTRTIVLQNAERAAENVMQQLQLGEIAGWVRRQQDLFSGYYQELWTVRTVLADYRRVKDIIARQARLVADYRQAYAAIRGDPHFSADELRHIYAVYDGILQQSVTNIDQLIQVITSWLTQMDDAGRLQLIDEADDQVTSQSDALRRFTQENILTASQRAKDRQDLDFIRSLYGIK